MVITGNYGNDLLEFFFKLQKQIYSRFNIVGILSLFFRQCIILNCQNIMKFDKGGEKATYFQTSQLFFSIGKYLFNFHLLTINHKNKRNYIINSHEVIDLDLRSYYCPSLSPLSFVQISDAPSKSMQDFALTQNSEWIFICPVIISHQMLIDWLSLGRLSLFSHIFHQPTHQTTHPSTREKLSDSWLIRS